MDVKDSFGRKVSLLNDSDVAPPRSSLSSRPPSLHSRASSIDSCPSLGAQTPPLMRSASTDSAAVDALSPMTPAGSFDHGLLSPQLAGEPFYGASKYLPCAQMPHHGKPLPEAHVPYYVRPPVQPTSGRVSSAPKAPTKKNQYPCPVAAQFSCPDYFTTSGHAARHAKKHTGRKDAKCPECNKAFTRKDNMEQHRRTHQNGRVAGKSTEDARVKKAKTMPKRPRPAPLQPSMTADLATPDSADSRSTSFFRFPSSYSVSSLYAEATTPGVTTGLDALAIAAASER